MEVCFSDHLRITGISDSSYELEGNQRQLDEKRLRAIAEYVSRADSAFPNTIILAANSRYEDGLIEEEGERWVVTPGPSGANHMITIPSASRLVAVIDGQHRLRSFDYATPARLDMPLVCSVFFDLNKPFQAQLFATINSTQKPVDRSLTFELFGYNISEESEDSWSPDKLAVFLTRKLNTEGGSPLRGRIAIAPEGDLLLGEGVYNQAWHVSMATVVDGIIRLFSTNPKQDSNELLKELPAKKRPVLAAARPRDRSPLRPLYLAGNDKLIYSIVSNYLAACSGVFWETAEAGSFIVKTVGIQALFDVLRLLAPEILDSKKASVSYFVDRLRPASGINFAGALFRNASGSGRGEIKNAIKTALKL
jgi:DNA phosphorothioation-associated DGQHR protein 1